MSRRASNRVNVLWARMHDATGPLYFRGALGAAGGVPGARGDGAASGVGTFGGVAAVGGEDGFGTAGRARGWRNWMPGVAGFIVTVDWFADLS